MAPAPPFRDTSLSEAIARAVALGESARAVSPPNPWVGCVLLRGGRAVGEGSTAAPGGPHAEVAAVAEAGDDARGATAVVTLEPCSHHGRTPPCADLLVDAGVSRVVVALEDPDPHVAGRGIARLRAAGVDVDVGAGADDAARSLAPYLTHRRAGRSFAVAKVAQSLDGRVAGADGSSRWVTGERARADGHRLRAESQAVMVGSGTALADSPALTVRHGAVPATPPLRVLLDGRGRVPAGGPLFDVDDAPTLVFTTAGTPGAVVDGWRSAGAEVEILDVAPGGDGVDARTVLETLAARGVLQVLLEGGPEVFGGFLRAGCVDRVVVYVAPVLLGRDAVPMLGGRGPDGLGDAPRLIPTGVRRLGGDLRLDFDVVT
ncbi:MAG: bifunctional diaminohydroxyphosphoribosylaminopyrimidine deaminase/5-amino-6-(5-phosphoribosylamino)uracil reductase RibD [Acidimicrobiia bacterium]